MKNTNKLEYKKVIRTFNNGFKNVFKLTTKMDIMLKQQKIIGF